LYIEQKKAVEHKIIESLSTFFFFRHIYLKNESTYSSGHMQRSMRTLLILLFLSSAKGSDSDLFCEDGICTQVSNLPIVDPCHDSHVDCEFWASIGECDVNPNYMLNSCAKSCGVCPSIGFENDRVPPAQSSCVDQEMSENCERRARLGECLLEPDFMRLHCKATCMYCVNEDKLRLQGVSDEEM
jgi:hypothetical protein